MASLPLAKPADIGFDPAQLQRAFDLLRGWAETGKLPGAGLCVGRKGKMLEPLLVGHQRPGKDAPAIRKDALFLIASITKPVAVGAVMMLVERGLLSLEDPVKRYLPKFAGDGRDEILVRHLMTHTSGLPDMVKSNTELRKGHKPFADFIEAIYQEPLLFPVGTKVSYQSMGTALLGEIVHQIAGSSLPAFLRKEVFEPLKMMDTSLGWEAAKKDRIAAIQVPAEMEGVDWNWNSPYWLGFGAPWGGMVTSPADFARYCQMMLNGGTLDGVRIFGPATVRAMTMNQLAVMMKVPEEDRRCKPWGLGWRLNWPGHSANFGDLLGPRAYGHWGATGTVCWIDPDAEAFCILFTTQPQEPEGKFLSRLCNAVAAALV
ncbi:MAG: beta-lactamase family protein [Planctomycetes bacterium]|nr:beta-lactamase family protein [Planctomycetota bacterium]